MQPGRRKTRIKTRATIKNLYNVEGKAELVHGEIVEMPPSGNAPGFASLKLRRASWIMPTAGDEDGRMETAPDSM